jgi:hypothetical protein
MQLIPADGSQAKSLILRKFWISIFRMRGMHFLALGPWRLLRATFSREMYELFLC